MKLSDWYAPDKFSCKVLKTTISDREAWLQSSGRQLRR